MRHFNRDFQDLPTTGDAGTGFARRLPERTVTPQGLAKVTGLVGGEQREDCFDGRRIKMAGVALEERTAPHFRSLVLRRDRCSAGAFAVATGCCSTVPARRDRRHHPQ